MLTAILWSVLLGLLCYGLAQGFKTILVEALNGAVDRAINKVALRLTSTDDERLYEATRQIVCDGIRRALKAERQDAEVERLLK
jgi:hypothetical protein